jgi:hypothetical protein
MFRASLLCSLVVGLTIASSRVTMAQSAPATAHKTPKTVVDFFLMLPHADFELVQDTPRMRLEWLHRKPNVIDVSRGYLFMEGDGGQTSLTVCLFKRLDRSYVVAVGDNDASDVFNGAFLDFYVYQNGRLKKVTRRVLPVVVKEKLEYALPRYGATIKVKTRSGAWVYDLVWNGEVFKVVRPIKRTHQGTRAAMTRTDTGKYDGRSEGAELSGKVVNIHLGMGELVVAN